MKYSANFVKTKKGNAIKENSVLSVKVDGAYFFSGGIYQNNFPIIIFQTPTNTNTHDILLKVANKSIKGKAVLKVRAYDKNWRGYGVNDEFIIL